MEDANRMAELRKLFYQQYPEDAQRTGHAVLKFFMYVQAEQPQAWRVGTDSPGMGAGRSEGKVR